MHENEKNDQINLEFCPEKTQSNPEFCTENEKETTQSFGKKALNFVQKIRPERAQNHPEFYPEKIKMTQNFA